MSNNHEHEKLEAQRRSTAPDYHAAELDALYRTNPTQDVREPLFQTFNDNSPQKLILAEAVAPLIAETGYPDGVELLDIGAGDGYLDSILILQLARLGVRPVRSTLIDRSDEQEVRLRSLSTFLRVNYGEEYRALVEREAWETYDPFVRHPEGFDVVICSHTIYHLDPSKLDEAFSKMVQALKPGGQLFVIARYDDMVYKFMTEHYEAVRGKKFNDINIQHALPTLRALVEEDPRLDLSTVDSHAPVHLYWGTNRENARRMMAFYFGVPSWNDIPPDVGLAIEQGFTVEGELKDTVWDAHDCIVRITKAKTQILFDNDETKK